MLNHYWLSHHFTSTVKAHIGKIHQITSIDAATFVCLEKANKGRTTYINPGTIFCLCVCVLLVWTKMDLWGEYKKCDSAQNVNKDIFWHHTSVYYIYLQKITYHSHTFTHIEAFPVKVSSLDSNCRYKSPDGVKAHVRADDAVTRSFTRSRSPPYQR